jgi:hypothetical protein
MHATRLRLQACVELRTAFDRVDATDAVWQGGVVGDEEPLDAARLGAGVKYRIRTVATRSLAGWTQPGESASASRKRGR